MTEAQKELYTKTKERLRKIGRENPADAILYLAEEVEACRLKIQAQDKEIDKLSTLNRLHERDVEDGRKLAESKVEEIHPEFMRDYKCMREELDGNYEEMAELQAERDELRRELKRLPEMILRECRVCLDFAKDAFEEMHVLTAIKAVEKAVQAVESHRRKEPTDDPH